MPCKTQRQKYGETCRVGKKCKAKYACIVEADESTRMRTEGSLHKYHEDHIAAKGVNSLSHFYLVHTFIPMPESHENTGCKGRSGKMVKLGEIPTWQLTKVRNNEVITEARNDWQKKFILRH